MPPFRSRRPSSYQLPPPAPHPSPELNEHPSSSPSPSPSTSLPSRVPPSAAASSSSSTSTFVPAVSLITSTRPRPGIITSSHRPSSRSNTTSKPRTPTTPRKTRAAAQRGASVYPTPPDSPASERAQPSSSPILPDSLHSSPIHSSRTSLSMSFFNSALNFLAGRLDVEFENEGIVDMLGGANTGTCYSLPGSVLISVPTLPMQMWGRSREIKDLSVVLEGKSEFFNDDEGRYTPLRIWTTTVKLATAHKPLLIPHVRSMHNRTELAVNFDLAIPGWLPPTHESAMTQTSYGIICNAVIGWVEAPLIASPRTSPLNGDLILRQDGPSRNTRSAVRASAAAKVTHRSTFDGSLSRFAIQSLNPQTTTKCHSTYKEFQVRRHRMPSAMRLGSEPMEPSLRHYALSPDDGSPSPVECVVSVPDWVDINNPERSLKIALRVRARPAVPDLQALSTPPPPVADDPMDGSTDSASTSRPGSAGSGECSQDSQLPKLECKVEEEVITRMMELAMEVEETERWTSNVNFGFMQAYPVPAEQPSSRGSGGHPLIHPRETARNHCNDGKSFRAVRVRPCLLADDGSQRNFYFTDGGLALSERWRKVNVVLPMPEETEKQKLNKPLSELDGPFYRRRHVLKIKMVCKSPDAGVDELGKPYTFSTPIRFGTSPATSVPVGQSSLPAYIQLFHENGERRECDALPIYTETAEEPIPPCPIPIPAKPLEKASYTAATRSIPACTVPRARPVLAPVDTMLRRSRIDIGQAVEAYRDFLEDGESAFREPNLESRGSSPEPSDSESEASGSISRAPPRSPEASAGSSRTRAARSAAPPPPPSTPRTPGGNKVVRRSFFIAP